jgi:hypothetical protein
LSAAFDVNASDTIPPDGDALVGQQDRCADDSPGEFGRKPLLDHRSPDFGESELSGTANRARR